MSDYIYYKVGGSLEYQHPTYVVRKADSDLYEGLTNGEFCYVLNSRQMGKSSLRVQMMKKLKEQGFKCASIDMTRIGSHVTPTEWYAGVVSELLRGFSLSRKVNFSSWWRDRDMLPPLQRLRELIEDVLLAEFSQNLVIFIDEIDSIIKIKFKEDFFAFIRACYNQRVDNPEYNRLTFCLLGVATPSDLITDKNISTPFNIGRAIELTGFQLPEVQPLIQGLEGRVSRPEIVLREVLEWTGGQPFLTQKLCKLIVQESGVKSQESGEFLENLKSSRQEGREAEWVAQLVRSAIAQLTLTQIIENWETSDEPEHLRTIRDRLLWSQRKEQLLRLYQQILQRGEVKANDTPEHIELRLSGLVVKQQGKLRVYNRIYASVFNQSWVENALAEAGLLLEEAKTPAHSKAEIQALEQAAFDALKLFESQQIEALILAMQAAQVLKALVESGCSRQALHSTNLVSGLQQALKVLGEDDCPLQGYPTVTPIYVLQTILDKIHERNHFKTHQGMVYGICFSPDGERLATVGDDGTVRLWNLFGQQLNKWQGHEGRVHDVRFSPNGQLIVTAGRAVRLWNLSGQQIAQFYGHYAAVWSASFSPDGQLITTAGVDGTAKLWNLSGQQIAQFYSHQGEVWSASFSPNGQLIATAGVDGTARLWNLSGQQIAQFYGHQGQIWRVSFSPDGQLIATAGADGTARLCNLSGRQLAQFNGHQDSVYSVRFSPDGQRLATAGYDGTARLWNLSGQQLAKLNAHVGVVLGICFSPDGQRLITAGSDDIARLWDLSDKHLAQLNGHRGKVWCVSFSPDGQILATAGSDGTARLWNLSGQQLAQLDGHQGSVWSVSFSPDGQYIVTTGSDKTARLWNLAGQQIAKFDGHQGWVTRVSFTPDGQRLATVGRDGTARLWDLSGQLISKVTPHQGWVWSVSFSPDGQLLATVGLDYTPPLLDSSGRLIIQLKDYHDAIANTSFSPDGQYLATVSSEDGSARLWNLFGQQLAQLDGHQDWVICTSFSPDGQLVATAGEDSSVCLWDLSGRQVSRFDSKQHAIYGMSFSPSGQCLATAGKDGTVKLWRIEGLDELLSRGCDWLKDYFVTHPEALEKLEVCQNRFKSLEAGKSIAKAGDVEDTISANTASPEEQAIPLAQQDEFQEITQFPKVPELPPASDSVPKTQIRKLAAKSLVALLGEMFSRQGDIEKAVAAYAEAQKLDPTIEIPATVGNNLCWWGSLWGYAADVMNACETAVALEPENGRFRDSRGLARTLTGNIAGAIEDFQAFVDWTDNQEQRLQRQRWLNVLSAGENPFTEEEIESLFNEYNVANLEELDEIEVCQDQLSSSQASRNLAGVGDIEGESALSSSTPVVCDRLSSESGIDYTRLRDLLSAGQWLEADLETKAIMLKIPDREAEGWLREEDIKNFPCTDLLIIDNLWVEYSQGRFGFSVQKEIWESVGGKKNADYEIYCLFCKRIGWGDRLGYRDFSWLSSCDLTFNTRAPVGHLPGGLLDWLWSSYRKSRLSLLVESADGTATSTPVWWNIIPSIASRLSECYIQSSAPTAVAQQRLVTTVSNKPGEGFLGEFLIHNKFVRIYQGDITNLVTDVIVSSDDTSLKMNGGVSWKIREVGGEEIYRETRNLIPLSLGNVAVTTAGKLQAKKIFHGVVMDWHHEILPSQNVIRQVVRTCIEMANQYGFKSIAFPLLGTGAGGFSAKIAWESIVLQIIRELSDKNQNSPEVVIVLYEKIIVKELNVESFLERINKSGWRLLVMHRRGETF